METEQRSFALSGELKPLVGKKVWLEYFDQNEKFGEAFTPQYTTIVRQFDGGECRDDWYLVNLEKPFYYDRVLYDHLVISSRWEGERVGEAKPTSIFVVLAPEPLALNDPFEVERELFVAWGMASTDANEVRRFLGKDEL